MIIKEADGDRIEGEGFQITKDKYNTIMKEIKLHAKVGYEVLELLSIRKVDEVDIKALTL